MSTAPSWQLQNPIDAIIFDCDGTLSAIEGIDELAIINNAGISVQCLTDVAMGRAGLNPDLYRKRLELVTPNQQQLLDLSKQYYVNKTPDVSAVIQILQRLNKTIYLVSAGLNPAVKLFGEMLNIPSNNIFAVDLAFDDEGNYQSFDTKSPFTHNDGKCRIIEQLKFKHETIAHIGDGANDYSAHDLATRFVGYGGAFYREHVATGCDYYINTPSLSALLPLLLTQQEHQQLKAEDAELYDKGLAAIDDGLVKVKQT